MRILHDLYEKQITSLDINDINDINKYRYVVTPYVLSHFTDHIELLYNCIENNLYRDIYYNYNINYICTHISNIIDTFKIDITYVHKLFSMQLYNNSI